MTAALQVRSLTKSYKQTTVVDDVSLSVAPGEQMGLLGPNGAGKTTLVRCICGSTKPDSGEVSIFDQPLASDSRLSKLGYIPQEIALYEDLTAIQNLRAFGNFQRIPRARLKERMQWALEWSGLTSEASQAVRTFSGGMKRRLNIACGVLHDPKLIILDEPTVGVDPQSRERIFAMLQSLKQQGAALLLTTHHLDEAETQCDQIFIMDHGSIVAQGAFPELLKSTIGTSNRLDVNVSEGPHAAVPNWHVDQERNVLSTSIDDVAEQIQGRIAELRNSGYTINDVRISRPTLHDVFLHLTGRQLRDVA